MQAQPVVAVGMVSTPLDAAPPVPTFTVNAALPFELGILAPDPNPDATVGAVELNKRWLDASK